MEQNWPRGFSIAIIRVLGTLGTGWGVGGTSAPAGGERSPGCRPHRYVVPFFWGASPRLRRRRVDQLARKQVAVCLADVWVLLAKTVAPSEGRRPSLVLAAVATRCWERTAQVGRGQGGGVPRGPCCVRHCRAWRRLFSPRVCGAPAVYTRLCSRRPGQGVPSPPLIA